MPDCFPEGDTATQGSDVRRSWIKIASAGFSSGGGGDDRLELGDGTSFLELGDGTSFLTLG